MSKMLSIIVISFFSHTINAQQPYNTLLGSYNGVKIYSNGSISYASNDYNNYNGTNTGMKWQCVEFVNRYYLIVNNKNIRIAGTNAVDYYSTASQRSMYNYANNSSVSPAVGDILCFGGGLGHVAIIREVGSNYVRITQQNGTNTTSDLNFTLTMSVSNGNYNISATNLSSSLYIQGWLKNSQVVQTGLAKISQGVAIYPSQVIVGNNFQSIFTLQETTGSPVTYAAILCAIVKGTSHAVDMEVKNNITIPANGSYQYSSTQQWRLTDPIGTYQAVARWKDSNGSWYDFTTTGNGINNKSFSVATNQIVLGLNPSSELDFGNVEVGQSKTLTFKVTNQSISTANLTLSPASPTSPFTLINNISITLTPGSEHIYSIKFTPQSSQSYNQIWYLTHNATNWSSPWPIQLKGNGTSSQLRAITISGQSIISNYGINIQVSPNDKNGNGNGTTGFIRYYYDGQPVTLTATPVAWEFYGFEKWLKNGSYYSNQRSISITVNGDTEYTAVYNSYVTHHKLNVRSSNPNSGVEILVYPNDVNGNSNGLTEFSRIYSHNTTINLIAPLTTAGKYFTKWLKSGLIHSVNPNINFSLSEDYYLTAVYENSTAIDYGSTIDLDYSLFQNYPNPFNPTTTISYSIPRTEFVTLKVFDMLGREVATLVNEEKLPGNYEEKFDGTNFPSGVYLYRMQAGNYAQTKKLLLLK
ncbi:MAG: CHAP domain-containing protein [Actinobacteria bacterium]|nr:CHAP domain-containing protein [Actinomycetota bacterium]